MHIGPFYNTDPIGLTLAADQQFTPLHPTLDAVWQILLDPQKPLLASTSFGLQARSFAIFPTFLVENKPISQVQAFYSPPRVEKIYSNYASLVFSPSANFEVCYELWAVQSTNLLSRLTLSNSNSRKASYSIQIAADLTPIGAAAGMNLAAHKYQNYLQGSSGALTIALVMDATSQPVNSPFPALQWNGELEPGQSASLHWRCSIAESQEECLAAAVAAFPTNWDAEVARLERVHQANLVEVLTPNADWNAVFLTSQNQAFQSVVRTIEAPDTLKIISQRNPDFSYFQSAEPQRRLSLNPPTLAALPLFQSAQMLLPARVDLLRDLLLNSLPAVEDTRILPSPRRKALPFPCLANLILKTFSHLQDRSFLEQLLPFLRENTLAWFDQDHDLDQDGLPEWTTFAQTGLFIAPVFDFFSPAGLPTQISTTESISLAGLLASELTALETIARILEDSQTQDTCHQLLIKLQSQLSAQLEKHPGVAYWDRDSHLSPEGQILFNGYLSNLAPESLTPSSAARINLMILTESYSRKPSSITISGRGLNGDSCQEVFQAGEILHLPDYYMITSRKVYRQIDQLILPGLPQESHLSIYVADLTGKDVGNFLAWQPHEPEEGSAEGDAGKVFVSEDSQTRYGLPEIMPKDPLTSQTSLINPAWNNLVLEHLLQIGAKKEAFELFSRLMQGTIQVLKQEHALYEGFSDVDGCAYGKRNSVGGLLSLELFLDLIGVRIFNSNKVSVSGENPLPWPVTVRFQGLEITRDGKNTTVTMPDGQVFRHFGSTIKTFQGNTEK
ncbi:MAG: hypothetical protein WA116_08435 [Anaerolineaceae bacterium]